MKNISRKKYLDEMLSLRNSPDIKVITGVRRAGKSELIKDYIKSIIKIEKKANIIYINLQEIEFEALKDYHELHNYVINEYKKNKNNYLFIDEVQMCPKFELAINSLHTKGLFDMYITGSNAFLLSSDLATLFTGRTMTIEVFPFSFKEFIQYFEFTDLNIAFDRYLLIGGMPGSYIYADDKKKYNYIADIFQTIILRDLIQKYSIKDEKTIENLAFFMMDNISNISSPNNITETLIKNNINTTHTTIGNYIKYLCKTFIFYMVKRYDLKGKKYLEISEKYYLSDHGFRLALLGKRNMDYGRIYENIVFIELLRRGFNVYVGKLYQKEIDFVAMKQNEKIYIQVSDNITAEETFKREVDSLLKIKDAYPKILIARTRNPEYSFEGIRIIDIIDYLLIVQK